MFWSLCFPPWKWYEISVCNKYVLIEIMCHFTVLDACGASGTLYPHAMDEDGPLWDCSTSQCVLSTQFLLNSCIYHLIHFLLDIFTLYSNLYGQYSLPFIYNNWIPLLNWTFFMAKQLSFSHHPLLFFHVSILYSPNFFAKYLAIKSLSIIIQWKTQSYMILSADSLVW